VAGFVNPRMGQVPVSGGSPLDALGQLLHWTIYGSQPGGGLDSVPGQLASSFDPRSRAGLANLASMFVPGGKFDATPQMEALGMHNQFEPYSMTKSPVRLLEGNKLDPQSRPGAIGYRLNREGTMKQAELNYRSATPQQKAAMATKYGVRSAEDARARVQYLMDNAHALKAQRAHDTLFGGEVHLTRGHSIPERPTVEPFVAKPPMTREAAIQRIAAKLGFNHPR
jgi:hypothetical protein